MDGFKREAGRIGKCGRGMRVKLGCVGGIKKEGGRWNMEERRLAG